MYGKGDEVADCAERILLVESPLTGRGTLPESALSRMSSISLARFLPESVAIANCDHPKRRPWPSGKTENEKKLAVIVGSERMMFIVEGMTVCCKADSSSNAQSRSAQPRCVRLGSRPIIDSLVRKCSCIAPRIEHTTALHSPRPVYRSLDRLQAIFERIESVLPNGLPGFLQIRVA